MKRAKDPVGLQNNKAIIDGCRWADCTIAAWGNHGLHLNRGNYVVELMKNVANRFSTWAFLKLANPNTLFTSHMISFQQNG